MAKLIYETKGRAREFCEYALNHYTGCGHGCIYCYASDVIHAEKGDFYGRPRARLTAGAIREAAVRAKAEGISGPVLLSFVTDPYQPIDADLQLTRKAIQALQDNDIAVTVLTKAGELAQRDFDILRPHVDTFATTLTCLDSDTSRRWEPYAGEPHVRQANLKAARKAGLKTWASCEPVIDSKITVNLIMMAADDADHFKIGTMNYHPHGRTIDWKRFAEMIVDLQPKVDRPFYLKKDLAKYLGKNDGVWLGA